jgi:guanosine-3',5'-bis(diphosphate) 3'-pyrophosphohydrolase
MFNESAAMANSVQQSYRPLLEAVSFAARAHKHQLRKDGQTPYAAHVFRACLILCHVFGIDDPAVLTAAVLHDTIEDTTTDFDDLEERFGKEIAGWVGLLSKDKRLQDDERERQYMQGLANGPWQVQVAKLADIFDNLMDAPSNIRQRNLNRARQYLDALKSHLHEEAKKPMKIVSSLFAGIENSEPEA